VTTSMRKTTAHVEIPAGARPNGYAYVHEVQLDGSDSVSLGSHVVIHDEGGGRLAAIVDSITTDELGRRYRRHLGH
jgi:hypothetical protein